MLIERDNYLTVDEYRRMIGYASNNSIRVAIRAGRLEAECFGGRWMISKTAILQTNRTGQYVGMKRKRAERKRKLEAEIRAAGFDPADILKAKVTK